jgi:hypothetical protein
MRKLTARGTRRRIALVVATCGVLATTISLGTVASGRDETNHATDSTLSSYGGGMLMATDPLGGYWTTDWVGAVTAHGGAPTFGSPALSGIRLTKPIVGMAATPDGQGYWLVGSDGGIFSYGDAPFYGSTGALHLNDPIVGMAVTPDGGGYWLVASDGGIFTFGDAPFYGSTGALHLNRPIIGMAPTADGDGYWLVASDGGIFTFGDAQFYGSLGSSGKSVIGIMINPLTTGYTLVETNGASVAVTTPTANGDQPPPTTTTTTPPPVSTTTTVPSPDPGQLASDCQPSSLPTATVDSSLDSLMADQWGPGWVGGDATYSTALPNGEEAFVFSDTLIGTAQPSGTTTVTGFTHSSELVGALPTLNGDFGGSSSAPQTLIPDTTDPGDQWQVAATYVENGDQLVFVNEFAPVPGSTFDSFTGHSGIAIFSVDSDAMPSFDSVVPLPTDPSTQWGIAVTQSGGYTYVYGSDIEPSSQAFLGMKIARVPLGSSLITGAWQYWDGAQWVSGETNAVPSSTSTLFDGVTPQQGVSGYEAVSIPGGVYQDKTVDLSYACSPTGPWSSPVPVYTIPQVNEYPDEIAYIPTFHPELSSHGLIISYNVDSLSGLSALEQDVHQYQPQFLQLSSS